MSCSRRLPLWAIVYGSISIPFLLEPVAAQSLSPAGTGYPPCSVSTDDTLMYGSLFSHNMLPGNASHCQWNIKNPDSDSFSMFIVLSVDLADSCQHYKLLLLEDLNGHSLSSNGSGFGNSPLCIRPDNPLLLRSNAPILRLQIDALESETLPKPDISAHFLLTHKDPVGTGEKRCQILCRWLQVASSSWPIETLGSELMPCSCTIEPASHGLHAPLRALSYASESRGICRGAHCYNTATYVDEEEDLWTPWSFWSSCSRTCGGGIQSRRRKCISLSRGLIACPGAQEEGRECNKQRCKGFQPHLVAQQRQKPSSLERFGTSGKKHPQSPVNNGESPKPVHKEWSQWSECSTTCGQGTQMRQRSCIQSPFASCDSPQQQLRDCNNSDVCPVHGAWKDWSSWSLCSFTCGRGVRTRSRDCRGPHSGGLPCEGTGTQTKVCNIALCPVDGHWADWADWPPCSVSCGNGTKQRLRECVGPIYGGAECLGPWSERRTCFVRQCPVDGRWLLWGPWSSCPVSCGGGSLRRERTCQGPFHGGRPCGGAAFENKPCSEHTCPAPHELCHEESWGSKTWQETLFGNVAYSQCPVDATGSVSRKCQLSSEGVAEWEKPSFWKCISHDIYALKKMMKDMQIIRQVSAPSMSKVIQDLADTSRGQIVYSGDILACLEVLRNFTDTCRRFRYKPSEHDSQNYIQIASNLLSEDNKMKWDDITQINPAIMDLVPIIVDFIHILGSGVKFSHIAYIFKENLAIAMHKVTPTDANTEIAFPAKGQEGLPEWVSSSEDRVVISRDSLSSQGQPLVHMLGIVMYKSLDFFLAKPRNETIINSRIITVSIRPEPKIKHSLLEIDFAHTSNGTKSFCVAWDTMSRDSGLGNWSTHDCKKVLDDGSHSRCHFERLSSFALMAQQYQSFRLEQPRPPSVTLVIGCAISSLALLLLIFVYTFIWRSIKSDRSVILINFCLSIISSNILILFGQTQTQNKSVCTIIAVFLHFTFLASFCWVLSEAWQSYMAVRGVPMKRIIRKRFLCLGWGLPALVVASSVGFTKANGYGASAYCWLSLEGGLLYAFVGPAAAVVLVNMVLGILVFNKLVSKEGIPDKELKHRAGASLWSSCVVLPLLALTWMSAVLAITDPRSVLFQILFSVFDSLQGCVIFCVHCILKKEVQSAIKFRLTGRLDPSEPCGYFQNGHAQIMTDFEKDVDLACRSARQKENTGGRSSMATSTLSRSSLRTSEHKEQTELQSCLSQSRLPPPPGSQIPLASVTQSSLNATSSLPRFQDTGGIPIFQEAGTMLSRFPETTANPSFLDPGQSSLRFQDTNSTVPRFNNRTMEISTVQGNESHCPGTPDPFGTSGSRFTTPGLQFLGLQAGSSNNFSGTGNYGGPVSFVEPAMRAEGGKRSQVGYAKTEAELARAQQLALEKDYIVLQSTAKEGKGAECTGGLGSDYSGRGGSGVIQRTASYPHRTLHHPRPHTSNTLTSLPEIDKGLIRQLMKGETGSTASVNSLDRRKTRYSELDFQKIMHTRKRHHEMLHEMSQKFQTMERGRPMPLDAIKMQDQMRGRWNPSSPANESIAESPLDALHAYWADENASGWARKMP